MNCVCSTHLELEAKLHSSRLRAQKVSALSANSVLKASSTVDHCTRGFTTVTLQGQQCAAITELLYERDEVYLREVCVCHVETDGIVVR